jgi:hypothetical protein
MFWTRYHALLQPYACLQACEGGNQPNLVALGCMSATATGHLHLVVASRSARIACGLSCCTSREVSDCESAGVNGKLLLSYIVSDLALGCMGLVDQYCTNTPAPHRCLISNHAG